MSKSEHSKPPIPEPKPIDPTPPALARAIRGVLIGLLFATVAILTINDLNSYDTWTHLAIGRLMWEERRIPDHEPFSYSQNREMTLEEAAPQYKVKQSVMDAHGRLVVSAGTPWDDECRRRITQAGVSASSVTTRLEPPLRRLLSDARDADGRVALREGTILRDGEIQALRDAGITRVETTVPWVNHEWLYQVPAYLAYKWFGLPGPTIYKAVILVAGFFILFLLVWRRETHVVAVAAVFLAAITSYKRFYMRPEIFSILFTAAWLYMLERYRRRSEGWWICIWMPALMIVWINTHGYFILGVAMPLVYLIGDGLQSVLPMPRSLTRTLRLKDDLIAGKAWLRLGLATLLTIGATFVNPYGVDGARYPIDVLQQVADPTSVIRTVIGEMQPPMNFGFTYAVWFTKALLWASGAAFLLNLRRLKLSRLLLWIIAVFFMLKALRNMPFFGIPGAAFMAINVNESWDDTLAFLRERVLPGVLAGAKWAAQAAAAGVLVFFFLWNVSDRFYVNDIASIRCGLGYSTDKFSFAAAEWVRDHPVKGPMYNAFGMGGLCMWTLFPEDRVGPDGVTRTYYSGRRLFIDGRAEMYGGPFVKNYTRSLSEPAMWKRFDEKWRFGVVFLNWQASDTQPLMQQLYQDPEWALVFGDGVGYVFVRNTPENREVIEQARRVIEAPTFVDFAEPYAAVSRALPGLPSERTFAAFQDRIQLIARVVGADPRLGDEARQVSDNPFEVTFDRRAFANDYDRLRAALMVVGPDDGAPGAEYRGGVSLLPARAVSPGEMMGVSGFALLGRYPDLGEAILAGLLHNITDVPELRINLANVYQNRGEYYLRVGNEKLARANLDSALQHYQAAERQMPGYPGLSLQLLRLHDVRGERPLVMKYLYKCIDEITPTVSSATLIASVCLKYSLDREALQQYQIAMPMLPEHEAAPLWERIAFCYLRLRRFDLALPHAQRAVELDDSSAMNWFTLGLSHEALRRNDEAIRAFRRCLDIEANFKPAQEHLQQLQQLLMPPSAPPPNFGAPR